MSASSQRRSARARALREQRQERFLGSVRVRAPGQSGSDRLDPAPDSEEAGEEETPAAASLRRRFENLEHETGFEAATLTLAKRQEDEK